MLNTKTNRGGIITNRFGSLVSERISKSSSLDKKKKRGKYSLFFSKYSFSPCKRINEILRNKTNNNSPYKHNCRLQNSPYFCVFKYARAVKQKVWNEAVNSERDWGETLKIRFSLASHARRALRARKTLTPRFTFFFFTDFKKKTDCFAVYIN